MDDPWDVKSVRKSGQYISCMKINGVPLLPPVLSKECRTEMQYYKLLAKEVEKRISILQPYVQSDSESCDDQTNAPEITECVEQYEDNNEQVDVDTLDDITKVSDNFQETEEKPLKSPLQAEMYQFPTKHVTESAPQPHLIVDLNLKISENVKDDKNNIKGHPPKPLPSSMDLPERDCDCSKSVDVRQDETKNKEQQQCKPFVGDIVNFSFSIGRDASLDSAIQDSINLDGPPSLSSKSFTGSLNNIHTSDVSLVRPLVRQRSYTILHPSPQLLAHLEVQSLNLGVDMSCISMSESLTNLSPGKKRRSWDLETAKAKWSNMALELKQKNLSKTNPRKNISKSLPRTASPSRARSVAAARTKYSSLTLRHPPKCEALPRARTSSPVRHSSPSRTRTTSPVRDRPSDTTIVLEEPISFRMSSDHKSVSLAKECQSPKQKNAPNGVGLKSESPKKLTAKTHIQKNTSLTDSTQPQKNTELVKSPVDKSNEGSKCATPKRLLISEAEDPAAKVRELYEKIQQQQLLQMASLVEKQKREQMLLQQAFEEQNKMLFKQLKTICPKSPDKVKEAWADRGDKDRGPVSLSQLINHSSPMATTLTDSNKCISYCDDILKKSKDLSSTLKCNIKNEHVSPNHQPARNRARTDSPARRNTPTSRKLNYDTSASSDVNYEPMLTDRTNDTLADLNVTFPSDSEECPARGRSPGAATEVTVVRRSTPHRSTDSAIKSMEQTIQKSINSCCARNARVFNYQPTARQRAAATTIVAYAKGYLVRRLMKTARVQTTVQTIKDALLCALQLHQDREGIRGPDVDLHRRLIQQITAACYTLHDTFVASSPRERCAMIAADRTRRASLAARLPHDPRHSDIMSQSHSGAFPPRSKRHSAPPASLMTQSNYETYSSEGRARRRPWR